MGQGLVLVGASLEAIRIDDGQLGDSEAGGALVRNATPREPTR